MVELNEYQRLASRTLRKNAPFRDVLAECALGLGEAGECQNKIKKYLFHGHNLDDPGMNIKEELGDNLWYIAMISLLFGYGLEDVAVYNLEKLRKRYPDGFSCERSRDRVV